MIHLPFQQVNHRSHQAKTQESNFQSDALVLHELATNASKYGSLSVAHGHLTISCWQDGEAMSLVWQETDGPPIEAKPTTKGFGSQLARKSVTDQLGGAIHCEWRREGLRVELRIPLSQLSR
ncbi:hypothetical protein [Microvirga sp. P5_D2]